MQGKLLSYYRRGRLCLVILFLALPLPSQVLGQLSGVDRGTHYTYGAPIVLFGGNSIDGWTKQNGDPTDGWIIDGGTLFRSKPAGDLYYRNPVRDFELHFQWKISTGGNSGVKYRVRQYGNQWLGCEYQILDDGQQPFNKHASGALYDVYEPTRNKQPVAAGQWNWSKIVVCNNRIEHWLNGHLVVQAHVGDQQWNERVQNSKFRNNESFGENREGRIFLQDHGNPVWFRHIVLVPLYCDGATAPNTLPSSCSCCESIACPPTGFLRRRPRLIRWRR